ncbi:hypothetical protein [Actinomycetospora soli]|uniref:hypothetical protein n=1 Tax=Actinomycetospora soli TaxID=2893887 RepID=UPI001E4CC292|nr:hypothetical protein [Actinomycetospora soli]MCD2191248.1 hypothetical protein [Actinomycetospora soli]
MVRTEKWTRTLHRDGRVTTTAYSHGGDSDSPFLDSMSVVERTVLKPGDRFNSMQFQPHAKRPIEYTIWPLILEDIERNRRIIASRAASDRIDQDMRALAARQEARKDRVFKLAAALVVLLIIGFILFW